MKIPKHIGAILLAICMLLSMSLNALGVSAAEPLDTTRKGSITLYKLVEPNTPGEPGDGTGQDITGEAIPNITFTIKKVVPNDEGTIMVDGNKYSVDSRFTDYPNGLITDGDGRVKFENLPVGIYYIEEVENNITFGAEPFLVSIPMTDPAGDGYLYEVVVYPKNDKSAIDKEVVTPLVLGSTVEWKITSNIPDDIATGLSYVITDDLDPRLDYVDGSVVVQPVDSNGTAVHGNGDDEGTALIPVTDYTVVYDPDEPGGVLKISLTEAGRKKVADLVESDNVAKLEMTFKTKFIIGEESKLTTIENNAKLEFVNKSGQTFQKGTDPDDPATVDPYGIRIHKVNNSDQDLSGAKFKIYSTENDAKNGTPALIDPKTDSAFWEVTKVDGYATILGLTEGTYWLVETDAPDGYKPLTGPIEVEVNKVKATATAIGDNENKDINLVEVKVINVPGFVLPQTGGAGTLWFTFIGLSLIGTAIVVYTISKKKKAQKA